MSAGIGWMARQLLALAKTAKEPVAHFNPRPAGQVQEGSATEAVAAFLKAHDRRFFAHHEIVLLTGRSAKSVDWALRFLRELGRVECVPDTKRNSRYYRYRAKVCQD